MKNSTILAVRASRASVASLECERHALRVSSASLDSVDGLLVTAHESAAGVLLDASKEARDLGLADRAKGYAGEYARHEYLARRIGGNLASRTERRAI